MFQPRQYPAGFGVKFAKNVAKLRSEIGVPRSLAKAVLSYMSYSCHASVGMLHSDCFWWQAPEPDEFTPLLVVGTQYLWEDRYRDANIPDVLCYLRGAKGLNLPPDWKEFLS